MTLCTLLIFDIRPEVLSHTFVINQGSECKSKGSQSSGSNLTTQTQSATPITNTMQNTMVGVDPTLKLHVFHGMGEEDPDQHFIIFQAIWDIKKVQDKEIKVT